jgi:hypothetical protein
MKSLDFAAMENIQGGSAGVINITLPLTTLLGAAGLSSLLGAGISLGLGIAYNIEGLKIPSVPGL